ncbi:MAG: tetratricopeptide repeat protein [Candidatus Krumholzibacteria bacterium]|nr:tetratricopeptide repeat protein [Candidatus Krumholzibacteria bacterium]
MSTRPGDDRKRSSRFIIPASIFLVALAVRLAYLRGISSSPAFGVPIVDSSTYCDVGRRIAGGELDPRLFWQSFFYPLYLALVFLSGGSILAAKVVQLVLGAATAVIAYRLGTAVFNEKTGLMAAAMVALSGPLIFFEAELLATGWEAFWGVAVVLLLVLASRGGNQAHYLFAGVSGGMSVLTRATFLPFFVLASAWLLYLTWKRGDPVAGKISRTALLVFPFLALILAAASLSYKATGHFSPIPKSASINLYIGNNPDAERTLAIRPGSEWRDLTREPDRLGIHTDAGHRKYFMDRYREYLVTQPWPFVKGLLGKTVQFVSSRELPRNIDLYTARKYSAVMSLLSWKWKGFGFPFGIILPLAVIGMAVNFRKVPPPMIIFLAAYPMSIILVFVSSMYRTAVIPVISVAAGAGLLALFESARAKNRKILAPVAAIILVTAAISTIPGPFAAEKNDYDAELHACVGYELGKMNRLEEAAAQLSHAIELDPDYATARRMLGNVLNQQGKPQEALPHFEAALSADPGSYLARYYLGMTLLRLGRREEATGHLRSALAGASAAGEGQLAAVIGKILQDSGGNE